MRTATLALIALTFSGLGGIASAGVTLSATTVNFGNYFPIDSSPDDSTGTITLTCSGAPVRTPVFSLSTGVSGTYVPRTLVNGSNTLDYNLYLDAARTQIFGDGSSGTVTYTGPNCHNSSYQFTIYGRIPAGQNLASGVYADSITVTATY